jgi:hypothetical protein
MATLGCDLPAIPPWSRQSNSGGVARVSWNRTAGSRSGKFRGLSRRFLALVDVTGADLRGRRPVNCVAPGPCLVLRRPALERGERLVSGVTALPELMSGGDPANAFLTTAAHAYATSNETEINAATQIGARRVMIGSLSAGSLIFTPTSRS